MSTLVLCSFIALMTQLSQSDPHLSGTDVSANRLSHDVYRRGVQARSSIDGRQAGGGDGLTVALALFVRQVKFDRLRQFWELSLEHFSGAVDDNIPALAARDSSQDQSVLEFVEVGIVRNRIAEVYANGLEA